MKIYFAYRHPEVSKTHRYFKEFEDKSILDWFQNNWTYFVEEKEEELLGISVWGFASFKNKDTKEPPKSYEELKEKLCKGCDIQHEIEVTENYIQILTDDDDFDLAYYIFDEIHYKKNREKLEIWFYDELPIQITIENPENDEIEGDKITPKGKFEGTTYYISNVIYETGHLREVGYNNGILKLQNTRIPNLLDFLRTATKLKCNEDYGFGPAELHIIQRLSKLFINLDTSDFFNKISEYCFVNFEENFDLEDDIGRMKIKDLEQLDKQVNPTVIINEHIIQVMTGETNYIFFDDLWLSQNKLLAESLTYYFTNWEIN